jgi:catechol-2,3-dioxygenase
LVQADFDAHGDYHHYIAQNAKSLPDDEETYADIKDYTPCTRAFLTKEALDNAVESCLCPAG